MNDGTTARDKVFARLMHKLDVASGKLNLATEHWSAPGSVTDDDMGAVALVHDVAGEIADIYCTLIDWSEARGIKLECGPWVESFDVPEDEAKELDELQRKLGQLAVAAVTEEA